MSETADATALLSQQFDLIYRTLEMNLDGMNAEHAMIEPAPGANPANWILAHLIQVQNGVMGLANEKPVWTHPNLPAIGLPAYQSPEDAFDWEEMKAAMLDSAGRCIIALRKLSPDDLAASIPDPFGGTTTRAALLNLLANHQPYHVGQLGLIRRIVGLPGAVKGPGERN